MSRPKSRPWIALLLAAALLAPGPAAAQDRAAARVLFDEGKKLVDKGDFAAACPKFQASLDHDPKLGTKLALAACYEKLGRTASAWAEFLGAAGMAERAGATEDARRQYAQEHARALEPKLTKLVVTVGAPTPGLTIRRDRQTVSESVLGVAVPVDPGEHEVTASADGYEPFSQKVKIDKAPSTTVTVPALKKLEVAAPPVVPPPVTPPIAGPDTPPGPVTPPADEGPRRISTMRWVAYGLGGAGLAVTGVGLVFGAQASSKWSDAKKMCTGDSEPLQCTAEGVTLRDDAASKATLSTIMVGAGVAAVAAGVVLIVVTPAHEPARRVTVVPSLTPGGAGLVVSGGF